MVFLDDTIKWNDVDQDPGRWDGTMTHTKKGALGRVSPEKWDKKVMLIRVFTNPI